MRLHGNAELSLNKRRRLATRVQADGWTLTKAAGAAEVGVREALGLKVCAEEAG